MDRHERLRCIDVLKALEEALSWLERPTAEGLDVHDAQRSGMFHLGPPGGRRPRNVMAKPPVA